MPATKTLLVDDHALVRESLIGCLDDIEEFEVVGSAATADEGVGLASTLDPDVILMDIDMPGMSCFAAVRQMIANDEEFRVIFVSTYTHDHYIQEALNVGGLGYVTKSDPVNELVQAIHHVAADKVYFSDEVLKRIVFDEDGARLVGNGKSRVSILTNREVEVLRYLARGLGKKEVAGMLDVSVKTVDKHAENLMRKLDIHDRVELARFAIREGLAEA